MNAIRERPQSVRQCRFRRAGHQLVRWSAFFLAGHLAFPAEIEVPKEYKVKAAFIFNFTKFIEWPAARFANEASPIVIGIFGPSPFGDELEKITRGREVNGRSIVVKQLHSVGEILAVHLLFVSAGTEKQLPAEAWQHAAVAAVGESDDFAASGGTITFTHEADKLRFEINVAAAERDGLKISAQLQKLATVVRRKP